MIYVAQVVEVLPEVPGIRVRFRDLVRSGFAQADFVRVLMPRMHETGGAASWLPEVDELGLVAEVYGSHFVWLGSLPFLDKNQADLTAGLAFLRHQSGVALQIRDKGDVELLHPSGLRITISKAGGQLPALKATSSPVVGDSTPPIVEIVHPSGAAVTIDASGNGVIHGFASLAFQDGTKRFSMEGLFDYLKNTVVSWLNAHVHTSGSAGSPTSAPTSPVASPVDSDCLSPSSFQGPQGA